MRNAPLIAIFLLLLSIVLSNCASTRVINLDSEFTLKKEATLVLENKAQIGVSSIFTKGDSLFAIDNSFNRSYTFHFTDVDKLRIRNYRKTGFFGGALIGAVCGLAVAASNPDPQAGMAVADGIIIGVLAGTLIGVEEVYRFDSDGNGSSHSK